MEIRSTTAVATPGSSTNTRKGEYRPVPIMIGALLALGCIVAFAMLVL